MTFVMIQAYQVISLTVEAKHLWITLTAQLLTSYHVFIYLFILVAYCLSFLNSCVNPIALYFLSKSFKTHYINQLCCGRRTPTRPARQSSQPMIRFGNSRTSRHEVTDQTEVSGPELSNLTYIHCVSLVRNNCTIVVM